MGAGNCAACHPAPDFTDFEFHNTGITQDEYDRVHGTGAFADLDVPGLAERLRDPEPWVPATQRTPDGAEPFRRPATASNALYTDLGVWNVFANPDFPSSQERIFAILCGQELEALPPRWHRRRGRRLLAALWLCSPTHLLDRSLAKFKTPGLRDLGHSAPYFHDGSRDDLEGVVRFYQEISERARSGQLRNADPEIERIDLDDEDVAPLIRFLLSLNEDYS
jgi:cytochrome c peroxidase